MSLSSMRTPGSMPMPTGQAVRTNPYSGINPAAAAMTPNPYAPYLPPPGSTNYNWWHNAANQAALRTPVATTYATPAQRIMQGAQMQGGQMPYAQPQAFQPQPLRQAPPVMNQTRMAQTVPLRPQGPIGGSVIRRPVVTGRPAK